MQAVKKAYRIFFTFGTLVIISENMSDYLLFFLEAITATNADDASIAKNIPELSPVLGEDVVFCDDDEPDVFEVLEDVVLFLREVSVEVFLVVTPVSSEVSDAEVTVVVSDDEDSSVVTSVTVTPVFIELPVPVTSKSSSVVVVV